MSLYPFQKKVKELVQRGRSVILQAPTGTGKTRAALAPYIESFFKHDPARFPRKCIYSVPMRVLANQFENEYEGYASRYSRRFREELEVKIQTGERPEDPRLLGDLIFATIDQSLSSALAVPYSLSARMANLNAGAFYGAYLVFDEFHLFPTGEDSVSGALVTTLQLLTQIKDVVPFVLMTATFSSTMLGELADRLDAEVVTVSREEYRAIASGTEGKPPRRRLYHVADASISADAVLSKHAEAGVTRSIAICNQVKRAQDLYAALRDHPERGSTEIRLLHSRFTQEDRKAKEDEIRREFGKNVDLRQIDSLILVATQVVEVGLDITCDRLHTEVAPANAVLQRAGRCARYPGEEGRVTVYPVPLRQRGDGEPKPDYLPYPADLCQASWTSFTERDGEEIDFETEQAIIDEVHTDADRALLAAMESQHSILWGKIFEAVETHERSLRRDLIRHIDSVTVLAAEAPADVGNPFTAQGFSLHRGSLYGVYRDLEAYREAYDPGLFEDPPWLMKFPELVETDAEDATVEDRYAWRNILDRDMINLTGTVVVNSLFCAYDSELGFRILPPGEETGWTSDAGESFTGNRYGTYTYRLESYPEHIERMMAVYEERFRDAYAYVQRRLADAWELPPDGLDQAVRLAIACHDLGKLDVRWQKWVRIYQEAIGTPIADPNYMAVHTDFDWHDSTHRAAQKKADRAVSRPNHAGESALSAAKILAAALGHETLARAGITSIARHHSPQTDSYSEYRLHERAQVALSEAMERANLNSRDLQILDEMKRGGDLGRRKLLVPPADFRGLISYLWIVRLLRLCDGLSQERE